MNKILGQVGFRPAVVTVCLAGLSATAVSAIVWHYKRKRTAEVCLQTCFGKVDASTQTETVQTAEVCTEAMPRVQTAEAETQADWQPRTSEAGTQVDLIDGISALSIDDMPQLAPLCAAIGQLVPRGYQIRMPRRMTMVHNWTKTTIRGTEITMQKFCTGHAVDGCMKTEFYFVTGDTFNVTQQGDLEFRGSMNTANFIKWRMEEFLHAASHQTETSKRLVTLDGVQVIKTTKTGKRVKVSAGGSVDNVENTETIHSPVSTGSAAAAAAAAGATAGRGGGGGAAAAAGATAAARGAGGGAAGGSGEAAAAAAPDTTADPATPDDHQASAQGSEDTRLVPEEAREVPSLFNFFQAKRLQDFAPRVTGLRQAFTILFSDQQRTNFLSVAVRMVVGNLAALNGKDIKVFHQAFDRLLAYVQTGEDALRTNSELLDVRIHHLNVLDVVFELALFGLIDGARPSLAPRVAGGFLAQLNAVLQAFLPETTWPAAADRAREMLWVAILSFLEDIFSRELSLYTQPQALADTIYSCLELRVTELLDLL